MRTNTRNGPGVRASLRGAAVFAVVLRRTVVAIVVGVAAWVGPSGRVHAATPRAALDPRPALDPHPAPGFASLDGAVHALLPFAGDLVVAGSFSHAGALETGPLARWTGSGWAGLGAPFDGPVHAIIAAGGQLIAGGDFTHAGGVEAAHLARWNGSAWEALGTGTDGPVYALAVQAGVVLFAGGRFDHAGGVEAHGIARWVAGAWSAAGAGVDGTVYALALYEGALVAAGDFGTRDSGGLDVHLARFTGGVWRTLALGVDAPVYSLAVYQGSLIAGGAFHAIDLVTPARGIARLTGDTWSEVGVGVTSDAAVAEVRALYAGGDDLVAGGAFDAAGLGAARNVARWDGASWSALAQGTDGPIGALVETGGAWVAGGSFTRAGDARTGQIAVFRSGRWAALEETPVAVSDLQATCEAGSVRLQWTLDPFTAAALRQVWVERAIAPLRRGVRIGPARPPAGGRMSAVDAAPDPGARWYHIVLGAPDGRESIGGTLQAPDPERSYISAVRALIRQPNGAIAVAYSIGVPGTARLDLFDVRGRLLVSLASGPHAAGAYRAVWSPLDGAGHPLGRGVYFARLQAPDRQVVRKFLTGLR